MKYWSEQIIKNLEKDPGAEAYREILRIEELSSLLGQKLRCIYNLFHFRSGSLPKPIFQKFPLMSSQVWHRCYPR